MHQLFLHAPLSTHCSQYLLDTGISIVVEVPIQAKMDYDDKDLNHFQLGSSREFKIEPPLLLIPLGTVRA
jgi:hypothetical protein